MYPLTIEGLEEGMRYFSQVILGACGIPLSNTTPLINEHLAGVAASEPWKVSARIGAGCTVEGKARPARCGVRLSCCLLSTITLFDLCMACFGVRLNPLTPRAWLPALTHQQVDPLCRVSLLLQSSPAALPQLTSYLTHSKSL